MAAIIPGIGSATLALELACKRYRSSDLVHTTYSALAHLRVLHTVTLNHDAHSRIDLHRIWGDYAHRLQTANPYQISSSCFQLSSCTIVSPSFSESLIMSQFRADHMARPSSSRKFAGQLLTLPPQQCLTNGSLVCHSVFESLISIFFN